MIETILVGAGREIRRVPDDAFVQSIKGLPARTVSGLAFMTSDHHLVRDFVVPVLKAASKSFDDVVRAGVFLANMTDFAAMNGVYAKYFSQPFPARTTIAAAALPLGACVEIDLVVKA